MNSVVNKCVNERVDKLTSRQVNKLTRQITCLLVCLLTCLLLIYSLPALSGQDGGKHRAGYPNIAVGNGHLAADSSKIYGINIGLLSNVDTLKGFSLGVLSNAVRGEADGVSIGGLSNFVGKDVKGVQIGGAVTTAGGMVRGLQASMISNISHDMHGVQMSGFANICVAPFRGVQLCGITNIAKGIREGMQVSLGANVCSSAMRGVQIGGYNYADSLSGAQIGLLNVCGTLARGVQIGVINFSRDTVARKIGLVNITPNTVSDIMFFGGTSSKINIAMRFRNRSTYRIIGIGTHYMGFDEEFSGCLYYRLGEYFHVSPRWTLSGDLGYFHVETFEKNSSSKPERLYSLQMRLNADYRIGNALGAFVTAGYGSTRHYGSHHNYRTRPMIEAGMALRISK